MIDIVPQLSSRDDFPSSFAVPKEDVFFVADCNGGVHIFLRGDNVRKKTLKRKCRFLNHCRTLFRAWGFTQIISIGRIAFDKTPLFHMPKKRNDRAMIDWARARTGSSTISLLTIEMPSLLANTREADASCSLSS